MARWTERQLAALRAMGVPKAAAERWDPKAEVRPRGGPENTVLIEGVILDSEGDEMWQAFGLDVQTSPANVRAQLEERCSRGAALAVEIDSPGGSFFAGATIGSLLAEWPGGFTA